MKENAPKKTWFQTLRTLWVPLAIGVVTVAALAVVVGMVWKDYRTAMMDSQTRQMELVVQSTADSIRVLLEEYADRLDSIAGKAEASKAFRPTVARSDTIRDVWLENSTRRGHLQLLRPQRRLRCPHHPDGGHLLLAVPQRRRALSCDEEEGRG